MSDAKLEDGDVLTAGPCSMTLHGFADSYSCVNANIPELQSGKERTHDRF